MATMLYTCLLLLAFDVISLAERSERLDHGDLSLSDVKPPPLTVCEELIWDEETIRRRQRRGMEVGKAGSILEERLLYCLDELGFKAFPAEGFHPPETLHIAVRFVKNPKECLWDKGPVALSVLLKPLKPSNEVPLPAPMTNLKSTLGPFACFNITSKRELRSCFHGHLPHGEEPSRFEGSDIYSPSTVFIRF